METEERPSKIRKIDGDIDTSTAADLNLLDNQTTDLQTAQIEQDALDHESQGPPDAAENPQEPENVTGTLPTSKGALRRLRRKEQWDAGREFRAAKRKEKKAARRERSKQEKSEHGPNTASAAKTLKSVSVPLTFLIDCGFDEQMLDQEITSISSQVTRCYSENRKASYRPSLAISSFGGRLKTRFDTALGKTHLNWKSVSIEEQDFVAVAQQARKKMLEDGPLSLDECSSLAAKSQSSPESGEIVYLTADSDETLEELQPYSVYIIGGIVDRNRHKGICYKRAKERGIKTAKLPIGELMQMNSRAVLATNHVNEIMLKWLEVGDWGKAFMDVIPKRKGGVLRDQIDAQDRSAVQEPEREDRDADANSTADALTKPNNGIDSTDCTIDVTASSQEDL